MYGFKVDLQRYRATSGERNFKGNHRRNFIEQIKAATFLEVVLAIEILQEPQSNLEEKVTTNHKPHLAPVQSVLQIRFRFRSHFQLLPQIRCLIAFRVQSSMISTNSNISDNIIMKVINLLQEKCRTKNGALRNSSIFL